MRKQEEKELPIELDTHRRKFLNTAAFAGLAGTGVAMGMAACSDEQSASAPPAPGATPAASQPAAAEHAGTVHLKPGELDTYYGLWSGGHTGDFRVLGLPSGRELLRVPCFTPDALIGWGITNESKAIMGTRPDGQLEFTVGDTHHVHASYKDGNYDGRYAWINDKINSRIARIRLDYFICDKITKLPNVQGFHGIFPDKRDPVDPAINYTTRVFCGAEFHIPLPNDGTGLDTSDQYRALFSCVDAETMEVRWQVLIDGNCDLAASSFDGKLAATNQYNTENGVHYEDMMSAERGRLPVLPRGAHRAGGEGRQVQDHRRFARSGRRRHARRQCGSGDGTGRACQRAEEPARREREPGRQVLHLRRQAVADCHRDRARQSARLVRRQAR
jgi:nitrous-oxide reductase